MILIREDPMTSAPKMDILFLIPSLKLRGAERMLVNLVNALDHDRFSIHVVSLSQDNPLADKLKPEAAILTLLPRVWRYDLSPARELHTMIRTKRIQAIIAFDIFAFFYAWMALWKSARFDASFKRPCDQLSSIS